MCPLVYLFPFFLGEVSFMPKAKNRWPLTQSSIWIFPHNPRQAFSIAFPGISCESHTQLFSCSVVLWPHGLQPARFLCPWDFLGKITGVGCHFLLQGIFQTQGLNLCLLHHRWILLLLSHWGSPTKNTTPSALNSQFLQQQIYKVPRMAPTKVLNQSNMCNWAIILWPLQPRGNFIFLFESPATFTFTWKGVLR